MKLGRWKDADFIAAGVFGFVKGLISPVDELIQGFGRTVGGRVERHPGQ